jgi:hypothetical protein
MMQLSTRDCQGKKHHMTDAVKELLHHIEQLSQQEQCEAIQAILLRATSIGAPDLSDDKRLALANESFLELDHREQAAR